MPFRVYTVDEANRMLPEIESSIRVIQQAVQQAHQVRDQLSVLEVIGAGDAHSPEHEELHERRAELNECKEAIGREKDRLLAAEVILRDLATGLVDFPSKYRGRLIYLCWRMGEESIQYWHETGAGAAGRRPVSELDLGAGSSGGRTE